MFQHNLLEMEKEEYWRIPELSLHYKLLENKQLTVSKFVLDSISQYDETVKFYTGCTNYMLLQGFFRLYNLQR